MIRCLREETRVQLEFVAELAREAGRTALAATAGMRSELKADRSYVTNVDREVERLIRSRLEAEFPGCGYYGEETGRERLDEEWIWVVDPIDGTTNFVHGLPIWGVS